MNIVGKTCGVGRVKVKPLGCLFSLCSILAASAGLAQTAAAAMVMTGGDARYCQIFLITGEPGKLEADGDNTLTLNDCPADKWKALNPEALKEEFKVSAVFKNGPQFWVVHKTFALKTGNMYTDKRDFGGIEALYAGTVKRPPGFGKGLVAYQEGSIA